MAAHDGAIGAQGSSLTHARTRVNTVHGKVCSRRIHIGKYAGRAAENVVLQFNALVHRDVILDAHTVPYPDIVPDIDILSQRTVPADDGTLLNMTKMPNLRSFADAYAIVDISTFVNEKVRHPSFFQT